jgi:ribosomal protein S18 acetylase RimI-like enzyme
MPSRGGDPSPGASSRAICQARVQRYASMYLDTSIRQTEALSLYRSLGFVEVEPYYDAPRPLRDWLVFLRLTL